MTTEYFDPLTDPWPALDSAHAALRAKHRIFVGTRAKQLLDEGQTVAAIELLRRELGYTIRQARTYLGMPF